MTAAAEMTFNRIRAAFMRRASAPNISHAVFKLAWLLAFKYMNRETQTARPSQTTLAADLAVSIRTVQRLLDILQRLGLVIVPGHGPNRASTYWIDPEKATPMSPINTTPVSPIEGGKGDTRRQRTRHPAPEKATPVSPQPYKKNQEGEPIPRAGARVSESRPDYLDFDFDEFYRQYPRKQGEDAARRAYRAVRKKGVTRDALLHAVLIYAATVAGKEPGLVKAPAGWLNDGRYKDEPNAQAPSQPIGFVDISEALALDAEERERRAAEGREREP